MSILIYKDIFKILLGYLIPVKVNMRSLYSVLVKDQTISLERKTAGGDDKFMFIARLISERNCDKLLLGTGAISICEYVKFNAPVININFTVQPQGKKQLSAELTGTSLR
jgi:hypothetical protein